ncbi:SubName: Full=Uncharacterized protein {ECO:0000313/EMBL:CCA72156.1} [Serendipita indica DSM 11827]|uniref:tRNA-guanine(15) transglycosylase-like domain-containing protein n=1 Tax=Serendipita indica (strain DSM 11827) TaxID=1109443 RepID=G4TLG1_SERID|nr:SubName: Full=Uncharacterized protein {ECO:0000313/EMBL:CCA72156.1} [Serendipita indica DSM 11827]CCA72156.1 hypothetical protein PIIN_06091 [Serendipita indica DSM 11827]
MDPSTTEIQVQPQYHDSNGPASQSNNTKTSSREPKVKTHRQKKADPPPIPSRPYHRLPFATFNVDVSTLDRSNGFGPRLGTFTLRRPRATPWTYQAQVVQSASSEKGEDVIEIRTPGMIAGASRGIVKHLSRDNVALARGLSWIHIPLEDFLEHPTPIPALHPATLPLHTYLTHPLESHILSLCLRDHNDNQNMPANTNAWVQAKTVRGVRKVSINDWILWTKALRPDLVWAFVDIPKTLLSSSNSQEGGVDEMSVVKGEGRQTSQKRIVKCLERSTGWVTKLMGGLLEDEQNTMVDGEARKRPPIIVPLIGGCDGRARDEFARSLVEPLDRGDRAEAGGLRTLDEGIFGYAIEMVDLPTNTYGTAPSPITHHEADRTNTLTDLVLTSLEPLDSSKLRIAHSTPSPHAILRLIDECGMDLFDAPWVAEAADLGIVLDFSFPVPTMEGNKARALGHNLFEEQYALDFSPLGSTPSWPCDPTFHKGPILHSSLDDQQWESEVAGGSTRPFSKAYIHHLLHTHEMSAYSLLHLHNLAVMDQFFTDIRTFLSESDRSAFREEIGRFYEVYQLPETLFDGAKVRWKEVEDARGKGRLKREREALSSAAAVLGDHALVENSQSGEATPRASDIATAVVLEAVEDTT